MANRQVPERMCVICKNRFPRAALSRFVSGEQGELVPDAAKCMSGRGYWLCDSDACKNRFAKFKPKSRAKRRQGNR